MAYGNPSEPGRKSRRAQGARFADAQMLDVPSDVMETPKLNARARKVSHKGRGKRFSFKDAGDVLVAAKV